MPSCTGAVAPVHGTVSSTTVFINEYINYTCSAGYTMTGPDKAHCVGPSQSPYFSPSNPPTCSPMSCPQLRPQPYGVYSPATPPHGSSFISGDRVTLKCVVPGTYVGFVGTTSTVDTCYNGNWSNKPLCKKYYEISNIHDTVLKSSGTLQYNIPYMLLRLVPNEVNNIVCESLVGKGATVQRLGGFIECYRTCRLVDGPNPYTGYLQVDTRYGANERVCVTPTHVASIICSKLGYGKYTSSIVQIGAHSTVFTVDNNGNLIRQHSPRCTSAIQCRAHCDDLHLPNGNNDCHNKFEGDICSFTCHSGYKIEGDKSRTCTATGAWTGSHTFCNGKITRFVHRLIIFFLPLFTE